MNTLNSLAYMNLPIFTLLEPWQINLSNPEAYLEPCQTSFCKSSQWLKAAKDTLTDMKMVFRKVLFM